MTSESLTRVKPACLTPNVCTVCGRSYGDLGLHDGHVRERHTCDTSCSAAMFRDLGMWKVCRGRWGDSDAPGSVESAERLALVEDWDSGWWEEVDHAGLDGVYIGDVPDVLGSPGTDGARLAMFDVLEETERRGWSVWIESTGVTAAKEGATVNAECEGIDELPKAVCLAAWGSVLEDRDG